MMMTCAAECCESRECVVAQAVVVVVAQAVVVVVAQAAVVVAQAVVVVAQAAAEAAGDLSGFARAH
jgi:hypothetical protein